MELKEGCQGNTRVFMSACHGGKLEAVCLCTCFDRVIGAFGEEGSSCVHCAADLWPLVTWSEFENMKNLEKTNHPNNCLTNISIPTLQETWN